MEFWNSMLTEKSWVLLNELVKSYNFILIGGWATYLWSKQQKSKDVDIVVSIDELQNLKSEPSFSKNDSLRKYQIKKGDIDVDIYTEHYSELAIPPENLKDYKRVIDGFNVVSPEALIVLKQGAFSDRKNSVKGEKDKIDIISLLFFARINFSDYYSILKKHSIIGYLDELIAIIRSFSDYNALGFTPKEFKVKKSFIIDELRKLR